VIVYSRLLPIDRLVYAHIFVLQEWHAKEGCEKVIENYFEVNSVGNHVRLSINAKPGKGLI
jgi:hypothetical protein